MGKIAKGPEICSLYPQIKRVFEATNLNEIFTWVYESYEINNDMQIHKGGEMSMGLGVTHYRSSKQKLNKKISTEAKLVGARDYVPYNIYSISCSCITKDI